MKRFIGQRGELDPFGNGVNTQTHRINLVMSTTPQTLQQISSQCNGVNLAHIRNHIGTLIKRGFAEEHSTSKWALTESAAVIFRAKDIKAARTELHRAEKADEGEPQDEEAYNPEDGDLREVVTREIRARRGQPQFRDALLERY